jgi:tetratricopeptide (TPR) repeat protein
MKFQWLFLIFLYGAGAWAQTADPKAEKALRDSEGLTREANRALANDSFYEAEANFRRAASKSAENNIAPYNLGNALYNRENYGEAFGQFKQAGERSIEKIDKHKAFHNMGNVYMQQKEYKKAEEAYKEALRNNPKDEESRYNLALAKKLGKNKGENEQQNPDQKDDQEQEDEEEKEDKNQEQNQDQNQDQNGGDNQENQQDQEKQQDGDSEKEENKEGDGEKKQEQDRKPEDNEQQPQQQRPNQLSPQQIQNLLQAMENEEKKVKEKIDAQKVKGPQIKTEKDW